MYITRITMWCIYFHVHVYLYVFGIMLADNMLVWRIAWLVSKTSLRGCCNMSNSLLATVGWKNMPIYHIATNCKWYWHLPLSFIINQDPWWSFISWSFIDKFCPFPLITNHYDPWLASIDLPLYPGCNIVTEGNNSCSALAVPHCRGLGHVELANGHSRLWIHWWHVTAI